MSTSVKRRLFLIISVLCLVTMGGGGYLYARAIANRHVYRTVPVTRGSLASAVSATGTLNAVITVQVGSQVSGQVKEMFVDFNSTVSKGQIIARINPDLFEAQVNQAKAQLDGAEAMVLNQQAVIEKTRADLESSRAALASSHAQTLKSQVAVVDGKRNFGRQHDLLTRSLIAQADEDAAQVQYDSAVAQYESSAAQERAAGAALRSAEGQLKVADTLLKNLQAQVAQNEANLAQAKLSLGYTIIRAPVDGVVVARNVDIGQTVAASLQAPVLFVIAQDLSKMQVDTNVDEADVGRVQVGQQATFTVDAFPGRTFRGAITQVRKAAQILQNVVTYDVVVSADNSDLKLLPGMTANIKVVTDQRDGVLQVPNAALRFRPPGVEADAPRNPSEPPRGPAAPTGEARPGGERRPPSEGRPAGARTAADAAPRRGGGQPGRVWVLGDDAKPRPVAVQLGISDGTRSEVLAGPLTEQSQVIISTGGPSDRNSRTGSEPRLRF
jgi:HlyD family secretion protein